MTKKMTPQARVSVLSDPRLKSFILGRAKGDTTTDISEVAREALSLHAHLADRSTQRNRFSESEVMAMLDAVSGWFITPETATYLHVELQDSEGLAEKWSVDMDALVERLRALHPFDASVLAYSLRGAWDAMPRFDGDLRRAAVSLGLLPQMSDAGRDL